MTFAVLALMKLMMRLFNRVISVIIAVAAVLLVGMTFVIMKDTRHIRRDTVEMKERLARNFE